MKMIAEAITAGTLEKLSESARPSTPEELVTAGADEVDLGFAIAGGVMPNRHQRRAAAAIHKRASKGGAR